MFKRILVPLDRSEVAEKALPVAFRIAQTTGASVLVLNVLSSGTDYAWTMLQAPMVIGEYVEQEQQDAQEYMQKIEALGQKEQVSLSSLLARGNAPDTIMEVATEQKCDLIVLCSHGASGLQRWVMGSVAARVARHSTVPTLILQEKAEQSIVQRIQAGQQISALVALDGGPGAETLLKPAVYLSSLLSSPKPGKVRLIHVVSQSTLRGRDESGRHEKQMKEFAKMGAEKYLNEVKQRIEKEVGAQLSCQIETVVLSGSDVASVLLDTAKSCEQAGEGAILALATHGRSALSRWIIGSAADRVLSTSQHPLLIYRPEEIQKQPQA
ncbi:nucleotide-binding universal stress UspA family protein [Thermosporothrix hazakensis]|jgi:nucleotide-binding universal stress UspA family protein|uniref:Nucleotide-binding universal stress UspA family protein n=1 Tax=Thermosporothrix hazakensis TaxID=644383 RepID=A0A326UBP1_THEHA|nr:universal stress protein [Thermosporothrix hazakensis]PZW31102.1 nucleotide-binding universal stress UspA family protein [Thermosporothrix hazakensis]GCE50984.1 universal stress protein UspA [Thermosporothrix hazakensis]